MRRFLRTVATMAALLIPASAATFTTKLTASDAAPEDRMGGAWMDGDTLVSRKPGLSGTAYVFVRSGGLWTEQAKLTSPPSDPSDFFAFNLAVDGDRIAVAAVGDDTFGTDSGAVYVFVRDGTTWSLEEKVMAPDPRDIHSFGWSMALDGDTLVVGAANDSDAGIRAGAAYVFVRTGGLWLQETKLIGSMVGPDDRFGYSVALAGDTLVVGSVPGTGPGAAVHVFRRSAGTWTEEAWLPSDSATFDGFGALVAVEGDTAVVAAPWDDEVHTDAGAAYVFERSGGVWTEAAKLMSPTPLAGFGVSIALDDGVLAVGATHDSAAGFVGAGSVSVYARSGGVWQLEEKITAFDAAVTDFFGSGVALHGSTLAVAAPTDDDAGTNTGSIYVYDLDIVTNTPPDLTGAAPSIGVVAVPNHAMVTIEIEGVTDPDGDEVTIVIDSIHQDEPVNGTGDGSTAPDASGVGSSAAQVRAERDGGDDGRVYHVRFTATDAQGGSSSGEVRVFVPRNGANGTALDGGALYDSCDSSPSGH